MGVVYRARAENGAAIALKVLSSLEDDEIKRFEREGAIRIDHPRIVQIYGSGRTDRGVPYIALELLEGASLAERFVRDPPSIDEVIEIGVEICRALEAVHARGLIHRDLKPSNIFFDRRAGLKLLDFGIAHDLSRRTRLTATGAVIGTPAYLSPEQACAERDLDATTDIWSLGAVLYEALTGKSPFERETSVATVLAVVGEELTPLAVLAPEVPAVLALAIERALSKNRAKRFQSAAAFRHAIEAARPGEDADEVTESIPISHGERRIVVMMLAEHVADGALLETQVKSRGGAYLELGDGRAIGLFGAENWMGDEVYSAVAAALEARPAAERIAIACGLASSKLGGETLASAERACRLPIEGVAILKNALALAGPELSATLVKDDVFEVQAQVAVTRDRRPLVGRHREMHELSRAVRAVVEEKRPMFVVLSGETGSGKSRIRRECENEMSSRTGTHFIFAARAASHQRYVSRSLITSALRARARLSEHVAPVQKQRAVRRLCADVLERSAADRLAPFIGSLLGVEMPETPALAAARGEPRLMADQLRLSLFDYFQAALSVEPVGMFFENLDWADKASVGLLQELAERARNRPLLVLFTATSARIEGALHLELQPLSHEDVARLVQEVAGTAVASASIEKIAERSGGNAGFVEQLVLALKEQGVLHALPEEWPLPITVAAAIQARLDLLRADEREVLKLGAILGRAFSRAWLGQLGLTTTEAVLEKLVSRGLLAARKNEYWLSSPLVREVAYKLIEEKARVELHARAAAILTLAEEVSSAEVARHYELAKANPQAAMHYANATRDAALRGDSADVLRLSERALSLGASPTKLFDLHMARADAHRFLGAREDQRADLSRALAASKSAHANARVLAERALLEARTKGAEAAIPAFYAAVSAAEKTGDRDLCALALGRLSAQLVQTGRLDEAEGALRESASLAEGGSPHLMGLVFGWRAQLATARGDLTERREAFLRAAALYREAGDLRLAVSAETNLADVLNRIGAYAEAETALRIAVADTRRVGHRLMEGYALLNLGYALARLGRTEEALAELRAAMQIASGLAEPRLMVLVRIYRARALLSGPRAASVLSLGEEAVEEARRAEVPALEAVALAVAAEAALHRGDTGLADRYSARALGIVEELGGIEEDEAEVYLARWRVLDVLKRSKEARVVLEKAKARVASIAKRIRDPEMRRCFCDNVEAHRVLLKTR